MWKQIQSAVQDAKPSVFYVCSQGSFVASMTATLRQMEDYHYSHLINTFGKMRTDVVVSYTLA